MIGAAGDRESGKITTFASDYRLWRLYSCNWFLTDNLTFSALWEFVGLAEFLPRITRIFICFSW